MSGDKLLDLCRRILDFAEQGDYANGIVAQGVDEGRVKAGEVLDAFRKDLEELSAPESSIGKGKVAKPNKMVKLSKPEQPTMWSEMKLRALSVFKNVGKPVPKSAGMIKVAKMPVTELKKRQMDARMSELEREAKSIEERAEYAEKAAKIKKRIADAKSRIEATRPPVTKLKIDISGWIAYLRKHSARLIVGLVILFIILLAVAKSCGEG